MSHLSKIFSEVPVEIQDHSGFDLSHENLFTTRVGTLTPCYVEEVYPADKFTIGVWWTTKMPPFATNFYGHVDAKAEFFFVPYRMLWGGWQNYITNSLSANGLPLRDDEYGSQPEGGGSAAVTDWLGVPPAQFLPKITLPSGYCAAGTLADYVGFRLDSQLLRATTVNALPFLAYHKVYDTYYRNALISKPFFNEASNDTSTIRNLPFFNQSRDFAVTDQGANGVAIGQLRQRVWQKDAFTTATTRPQFSEAASVKMSVDEGGDSGFTIASLRAANALQKFLERNNLGTVRYYDQILVHFGVRPCDGCMNKPIFLGSVSQPVYVNTVSSQGSNYAPETLDGNLQNANPWYNVGGSQYGQAMCVGDGSICDNYEFKEHGLILGLFSIVPHANYASGIRRYLRRTYAAEFVWPEFAGIGDQSVFKSELYGGNGNDDAVFGYNRRYYEALYHDDEVHGEFLPNQTLRNFVLSRSFNSTVALNTQFMEIPVTAMDNVFVQGTIIDGEEGEKYPYEVNPIMVDMYITSKALRRLPESPLPHL